MATLLRTLSAWIVLWSQRSLLISWTCYVSWVCFDCIFYSWGHQVRAFDLTDFKDRRSLSWWVNSDIVKHSTEILGDFSTGACYKRTIVELPVSSTDLKRNSFTLTEAEACVPSYCQHPRARIEITGKYTSVYVNLRQCNHLLTQTLMLPHPRAQQFLESIVTIQIIYSEVFYNMNQMR